MIKWQRISSEYSRVGSDTDTFQLAENMVSQMDVNDVTDGYSSIMCKVVLLCGAFPLCCVKDKQQSQYIDNTVSVQSHPFWPHFALPILFQWKSFTNLRFIARVASCSELCWTTDLTSYWCVTGKTDTTWMTVQRQRCCNLSMLLCCQSPKTLMYLTWISSIYNQNVHYTIFHISFYHYT